MRSLPAISVKFYQPTNGYWDGGPKTGGVFEPKHISSTCGRKFYGKNTVKWGSWDLNFFFTCKRGKTWAESARIAARRIRRMLKVPATVKII